MIKKNAIFIVPYKDKYCGIYNWTLKVSNFFNPGQIYTLESTDKAFNLFRKLLFNRDYKISILGINYTPFYWGPFYKQFLIISILLIVKIFKPKIKISFIMHDFIRPKNYNLKGFLLIPYLYFLLKLFIILSTDILTICEPVGLLKHSLNKSKKVSRIKAHSSFERPRRYIKEYPREAINLLIFGSIQAYKKYEIKFLEDYIFGLSKFCKINLFLLGSARNLNIDFKKARCSLIRISHIYEDKEMAKILMKSSLAVFFHSKGVTFRSSVLATAMQYGIPIIGIKGINTENLWKELYGLFLYDYDSVSLAINESLKLIRDEEEYLKCSDLLQKYYDENYSWERIGKILNKNV